MLQAFTGWEVFLESTFLLYLVGHKAPKAPKPLRCGFPANLSDAAEWCIDGKDYAKWQVHDVRRRADRWLDQGKPFTPAIQTHQTRLTELITIRNAIAHDSGSAKDKFENLVRRELRALPPNTTVGNFLMTLVPNETPPKSYFELYLEKLEDSAKNIVPR